MPEKPKFTSGQVKFWKESKRFLNQALDAGKEEGNVPLDVDLELIYDTELKGVGFAGKVGALFEKGRRTVYEVSLPLEGYEDRDWKTVSHEGGHVFKGHPSKGTPGEILIERGDFLGYLEREIEAELAYRKATKSLPFIANDLLSNVFSCLDFFGLLPEDSFEAVKSVARKQGIPYKYIKQLKRYLDESKFFG